MFMYEQVHKSFSYRCYPFIGLVIKLKPIRCGYYDLITGKGHVNTFDKISDYHFGGLRRTNTFCGVKNKRVSSFGAPMPNFVLLRFFSSYLCNEKYMYYILTGTYKFQV